MIVGDFLAPACGLLGYLSFRRAAAEVPAAAAANGLAPIALEIWNGFIFLNVSQAPEATLREHLAGFALRVLKADEWRLQLHGA